MLKDKRGFTIIELLVVVAVIAILSLISVFGFNAVQAGTRDSQRSSRVTQLAEALEKYYAKNGEYPSCSALTSSATSAITTLSGLDPTVLVTPKAAAGVTNSIDPSCATLSVGGSSDVYAYVGDGSTTCATGGCLKYTLQYVDEGSNTVKSIASRHSASISTSGNISCLTAAAYSFSRIDLSWCAISGAASYNIRYATNAAMTSPTAFTPAATTISAQVTGLSLGTQYWLQVQPVDSVGTAGNWSNIATATTYTLGTPNPTVVADPGAPSTQILVTWAAITNATTYTLIYNSTGTLDVNGVLTSPTTVASATSPYTLSSLSAGSTRYFQVRANASGLSGGYSAVDSATTQVPVPTGVTCTANSETQITANWTTVSVATTYTLNYSTSNTFATFTAVSGIATNSKVVTGLSAGTTYYCRVYAFVGATSSAASATSSATTTSVNAPTSVGWSGCTPNAGNQTATIAGNNWVGNNADGLSGTYYAAHCTSSGSCSGGATYQVYVTAWYAVNSGSTHVQETSEGWTSPDTFYFVNGRSTWLVFMTLTGRCVANGIVSSQVGGGTTAGM